LEISVKLVAVVLVGAGGIALVFKGEYGLALSCFTAIIGAAFGYAAHAMKVSKGS
jgi:hypothetical protein